MTHDELLNKITTSGDTSIEFALRAVVERHEPSLLITKGFPNIIVCGECNKIYGSDEDKEYGYPCKTIEDIEKELR